MPREAFGAVYEIAADQFGYLTAAQARDAGVSPMALVMMERRQTVERVSHGVYRLVQFAHGPLAEYMEATLWPVGTTGVISHESALALYGVSDVNPGKIHLTVPANYRVRRRVPNRLRLHHAALGEDDRTLFEGIPVTTMARTIRDCRPTVGEDVLRQALVDAERNGLLSRREAETLRKGDP
ncbi:MAG TPA: type IV toxin-antitoxin system AbiEi family antitoxin domain-containing protein [Longimicrobium sp.]|nr:type IV toxin-antitoxin system AbiEi family antitoxin domain-containing protein [Longimicrobium sp.]